MGNRGRRSRISKKNFRVDRAVRELPWPNRGAEKYFFLNFDLKIVLYGVIEVGEAEYETFFEIGQAVRELP
jgi:hypothetical protein